MTVLLISPNFAKRSVAKILVEIVLLNKNMKMELNIGDLEVILTSFKYSKLKIAEHQYPGISHEEAYKLRTQKLNAIENVELKIRSMKKDLK